MAGANATAEPLTLTVSLPMMAKGDKAVCYTDDKERRPSVSTLTVKNPAKVKLTMQPSGGVVLVK